MIVDTGRDAAIGGVGGEVLGRHQGHNAHGATTAGTGAGIGATGAAGPGGVTSGANTTHPTRMHGKIEEVEGKLQRGVGEVTRSTNMT